MESVIVIHATRRSESLVRGLVVVLQGDGSRAPTNADDGPLCAGGSAADPGGARVQAEALLPR